ncbi:MAG: hypothetical protein JXR49_15815 [Acidobacteria bacterium]|nr:hypothetical protein [Acidobacteriota bacterium]
MNNRTVQIPKLAFFAGVVTVCLLAPALLHSCPVDGHDDACGSNHRCLICSIFNHTILNPDPSDCIAAQPLSILPVLIEPILNRDVSYQGSLPARAPPPSALI